MLCTNIPHLKIAIYKCVLKSKVTSNQSIRVVFWCGNDAEFITGLLNVKRDCYGRGVRLGKNKPKQLIFVAKCFSLIEHSSMSNNIKDAREFLLHEKSVEKHDPAYQHVQGGDLLPENTDSALRSQLRASVDSPR